MLTQYETELMNLLWQYPQGLTNAEMIESPFPRDWRDSTVHILINGLLRKEMITVVGKRPSGRRHSRIFAPTMTQEAYNELRLKEKVAVMGDEDMLKMFSAFVETKSLSAPVRKELLELLERTKTAD